MKETRIIALVDVDGPIADFDGKLFKVCAERGWPMDVAHPGEQRHRYSTDHIPDLEHRAAMRAICDDAGWFSDLPLVEGALDGLERLSELCEVWLCTKPLRAAWRTCASEKTQWIEQRLGSHWTDRLIITPDKSLVRGHVLLDDAPYLSWLDRAEWTAVMFPASWNGEGSQWEGLPRWGWKDDPEDLINLVFDSVK